MTTATNKMQYARVGNSGLRVSKLIVGCMSFGDARWYDWVLEGEDAMKHIKAAYDLGLNTFDTADAYSNGQSERLLGQAFKKYNIPREKVVIMTKLWGCLSTDDVGEQLFAASPATLDSRGYSNQYGLNRKHIFAAVKDSLERLQVEYIDVLQCHRYDPNTPIEETMQALHDVVRAGYVRYIGMSSCFAYQFHIMQNYAINNKLTPFISMQNHYSLVYREEEREMFPTLKHFGVGAFPWSPLARGTLTRPLSEQTKRGNSDNWSKALKAQPCTAAIVGRVEEIAKKHSASMAQIALAWVLSRPGVTAPIVGTSNLKNLEDLVGALSIELTEEEKKYLGEEYRAQALFNHIQAE